MKNIFETLAADGSFQTLLSILHMAGMENVLGAPGPFTLFAPNDEAFKRVMVEELTADKEQAG